MIYFLYFYWTKDSMSIQLQLSTSSIYLYLDYEINDNGIRIWFGREYVLAFVSLIHVRVFYGGSQHGLSGLSSKIKGVNKLLLSNMRDIIFCNEKVTAFVLRPEDRVVWTIGFILCAVRIFVGTFLTLFLCHVINMKIIHLSWVASKLMDHGTCSWMLFNPVRGRQVDADARECE